MFNLTVEDASKRLGVGRARVNQLIRSGMLAAEKVGGICSSTSRAWKRVATPLRRRGVLLQVPAKGMWGATC